MKISELVAALTAELIRGNDAEIGFTVPVEIEVMKREYIQVYEWRVNNEWHTTPYSNVGDRVLRLGANLRINRAQLEHREDGVMEIVLT